MKQSLVDVAEAVRAAGFPCEIDEPGSVVIAAVSLKDKRTGAVLKAAMDTGHQITGGRATARGFELVVS